MFKNILPKQQEGLFDSVPTTTLQTYFILCLDTEQSEIVELILEKKMNRI